MSSQLLQRGTWKWTGGTANGWALHQKRLEENSEAVHFSEVTHEF